MTETAGDYRGAVWVSTVLAAMAVGAVAASRAGGADVGVEEAGY
ncbi:hypothetical protein ACFWMG_28070 [Streptomyces sp. NPDC127074]